MLILILAIIKSVFIKESSSDVVIEAMGLIATAAGELETVTITHHGGTLYAITTTRKLTGRTLTVYRNSATGAMGYFSWVKETYKMS